MKYIRTLLLSIKIFDIIPFFILKIICFPYKKNCSLKFRDNNELISPKVESILIWLDYSNAIGDFFSILKVLIQFDKLNKKYTLIVPKKFTGIVESLNFKNASIVYKDNSLGTHYKNNIDINKSISLIDDEFMSKKLCFDKIYYFNGVLLVDALTAIKNIKYNKILMIDPKIFLRGRHSKFIDRNHIKQSLFYLINKKKFVIEIIKNKEYKKRSISFIVSDILGVNVSANKLNNYKTNNNILISSGASNSTKVLMDYKLEDILNLISFQKNKIFVGSVHDNKFISNLIGNPKYKFYFDLSLFELFNLVKDSDMIISYDTGLYHIAKFYEKEVLLLLNKNDFAYKYMKNYWISERAPNESRFIFPKKYFNK